MIKIGVCVICYNRLEHLDSLFSILDAIKFENQVEIIASVDYSTQQSEIEKLFELFSWRNVMSRVIKYEKNLGLKEHVLRCGDLTTEYDILVLLEEDLCVSPYFESYIESSYYLSIVDPDIGGISLYSYNRNESDKIDFWPNIDSMDNYFIQFPSSWGFAVTAKQWQSFRIWLTANDCDFFDDKLIPKYICDWGAKSWKKHFARYLVHSNKYFSYPRFSLTSNPGIAGSHHYSINGLYSVPICQSNRNWRLGHLKTSLAVYDINFLPIDSYGVFDGHYSRGSTRCDDKGKYITDNFYLGVSELFGVNISCINKFFLKLYGKLKSFL
ncbi:glycosyltransferase [Vibrio cholerae]|uniref:glycosyltransferase n=1 Tax=Vibrio cholerae TaxID=666 RepID=UPI0011DA0748|nr:hypothetical protein [Vibrio cholerae]TXY73118.1 hypothetical protein FXE81_01985 [Vibrio cholerae]BCN21973.1 hypothetical protein [Vibrio cholerae]GIB45636.1 hypothetical protein VCSRO92_2583 [Vibrio cholerae]